MNLLIDLGNSRLKWAQQAPGAWRSDGVLIRASTMESIAESAWGRLAPPRRVVVCSVSTAERTRALHDWLRARWSVNVHVVQAEAERLGVRNGYRRPEQLGADRWAALIGARGFTERALCVVDAGTAVTVDALTARGEHLGGAIFPGLGLLRTAVTLGTAGIARDIGDASDGFGRSTEAGVAGGTLHGLAGAVDRLVEEQRDILGADLTVYLTGGDAELLRPHLRVAVTPVPDLVLQGLARIADAL